MPESIRIAPLPTDINTDLGPADSSARTKTAKPTSASLAKGGSQIENLRALGSRGAAGKAAREPAKAPLARDLSLRERTPQATAPAAAQDDGWSELDDIFRRQPGVGPAGIGASTHSLIDAPQAPLRSSRPGTGPKSPVASQEPAPVRARSSGMLGTLKRSAKNLLGLGRSSSSSTPKPSFASRPPRVASRPPTAPEGSVGETVEWIHEQHGRPAAWRNAIPKLSVEQARREGVPVPTRRPPPPPQTTGRVAPAVHPAALAIEEDDLFELDIGSGMVSKPRAPEPEPAARHDEPGPPPAPRQASKRRAREGVDYELPDLGPLFSIPEGTHENGALASLGQHYDGLWHDLRGSVNGATSALRSLRTTPKKGLAAKRAELEGHAAELSRLIAETGMAEVDLATVQALKAQEEPQVLNKPDSLRTRAVLADRDIHETIRQRNHAQTTLRTLQRAIASLPLAAGR